MSNCVSSAKYEPFGVGSLTKKVIIKGVGLKKDGDVSDVEDSF